MLKLKNVIKRMDENYKLSVPDNYLVGVTYSKHSGVYLASFTYMGSEVYQPKEFKCYIIIPE